jgi:riboflavin transporter FmnP
MRENLMGESTENSRCGNCGTSNPSKNKFCKKCGATLIAMEKCPQCGNSLDKDSEFCPECGYKLKQQQGLPQVNPGIRKLPLGLEIMIVLGLLGAAIFLFSSMMGFYTSSIASGYGYSISGDLALAGFIWGFIGLYLLAVSWGLWKLKEWSRKVLMFQALLGIIVVFFEPIPGLASLVYSVVVLWYINQPTIKGLFQTGQVSSVGTQPGQAGKIGSMAYSFPKLNGKVIGASVAFVVIIFLLYAFRVPALWVEGYGYLTFWQIPAISAFLILGPVFGLLILFINALLGMFLGITSSVGVFAESVEVLVLMAGIFIAQRLILRRTPQQTKLGIRFFGYSIILGSVLSIVVLIPLNYAILLHEGHPIYHFTANLSNWVLFNVIAIFYTVPIGYLIAKRFNKKMQ